MPNFHIVLSRAIDLDAQQRQAEQGLCPRHAMVALRDALQASIHAPSGHAVSMFDKGMSKLASTPAQWALARQLKKTLGKDDVVFCSGEDVGIPIAALCGGHKNSPKILVYFHNINRPRGRLALRLLGLAHKIDTFMACTSVQTEFLRHFLKLPADKVLHLPDSTDTQFFSPGKISPTKARPLIMSVGLEQRDYRTLAAATADLDIDVKISGFSRDAAVLAQAFPDELPANMTRQFYEWPDLQQLYRDADVVVVSLKENPYAAGVQCLMEGWACKKPVVISATSGMVDYIGDVNTVKTVAVGDVAAMRAAILELLSNKALSIKQAQAGFDKVLRDHNAETQMAKLAAHLQGLAEKRQFSF